MNYSLTSVAGLSIVEPLLAAHPFRIPRRVALGVLCLIVLGAFGAAAQSPIKTITLDEDIIDVAVDRPGDLYITLRPGKIIRIDADGNSTPLAVITNLPSLFDPRDGARLFAYYRNGQRYMYFSISREMSTHALDSAFAIEPWLVCPSGDHNIWIADAADNTLRKVNLNTAHIDAEIPCKGNVSAIRYMREYQGFLFVLQQGSIEVYSGMGKMLRTIGNGTVSWFNFLGEELYYRENDQLVFFNLFTAETRRQKLPQQTPFSIVTDTRTYSIGGRKIEIYGPLR